MAVPAGGAAKEPESPSSGDRGGGRRLSSHALREDVARKEQGRRARHAEQVGSRLRIEVLHDLSPGQIRQVVADHGGILEGEVPGELVQARVPFDRLEDLEAVDGIEVLRPAYDIELVLDDLVDTHGGSVVGQHVQKMRVDLWHQAGYDGSGVKVGIIDVFGQDAWDAAEAAGEVPAPAGTRCISNGSSCTLFDGGSTHGVGVAEMIHDSAPGAQLYLGRASTTSDLQALVNWFASQGVDIISRSLARFYDGPGDGTGPFDTVVNSAVSQGMLFVNSAGNNAGTSTRLGSYIRTTWSDPDNNGRLNWPNGSEALLLPCPTAKLGTIYGLRWSDWGIANSQVTDYALHFFDSNGDFMFTKDDTQGSRGGTAQPLEAAGTGVNCPTPEILAVVDLEAAGGGTAGDVLEFQLHQTGVDPWSNPGATIFESSNVGALGVGAIDPALGTTIAPYSSHGPTNDGRFKPDLSAAACVSSFTISPCFNGTSAAAPAVSGAAAVILDAGFATTAIGLANFLRSSTIDRGTTGQDNVYGYGELILTDPPTLNVENAIPIGAGSGGLIFEGDSGTGNNAYFNVVVTPASKDPITVSYTTVSGTAQAPGDYTTVAETNRVIPAQQTTFAVIVPIKGDTFLENHESFSLQLTGATNARIGDGTGAALIGDDDTSIVVNDRQLLEGDSGTKNMSFLVSLTSPTVEQVGVDFATQDGTATAGSDYVATSGQRTFIPPTSNLLVNVPINGDTDAEDDETFTLNLSSPVNATIADGVGVGTILNDDEEVVPPEATILRRVVKKPEGDRGKKRFVFRVRLDQVSTEVVTIDYLTRDKTATAGQDYVANTGTLTFDPGVVKQRIVVKVKGDTRPEPNERFLVKLRKPVGVDLVHRRGVGVIVNDD